VPRYDALFPEWFLTGLNTETLIRDLSPLTTSIYDTRHGRYTNPPAAPPPALWLTEINLNPMPQDNDPSLPPPVMPTKTEALHIQAKIVLRYLSSYVNKGAGAVYFFAAKTHEWPLVAQPFFDALDSGRTPTSADAGETMAVLGRFTRAFDGPPITHARRLSLLRIRDFSGHAQFAGDGTRAHPPLYDGNVLAAFPFQLSNTSFAIPVYVMTRDVSQPYAPAGSPHRFDLPPERFGLTLGGIKKGCPAMKASYYDPTSDTRGPVAFNCHGRRVSVQMPVTDSPRLLMLEHA
jgi:hypothetical protein